MPRMVRESCILSVINCQEIQESRWWWSLWWMDGSLGDENVFWDAQTGKRASWTLWQGLTWWSLAMKSSKASVMKCFRWQRNGENTIFGNKIESLRLGLMNTIMYQYRKNCIRRVLQPIFQVWCQALAYLDLWGACVSSSIWAEYISFYRTQHLLLQVVIHRYVDTQTTLGWWLILIGQKLTSSQCWTLWQMVKNKKPSWLWPCRSSGLEPMLYLRSSMWVKRWTEIGRFIFKTTRETIIKYIKL